MTMASPTVAPFFSAPLELTNSCEGVTRGLNEHDYTTPDNQRQRAPRGFESPPPPPVRKSARKMSPRTSWISSAVDHNLKRPCEWSDKDDLSMRATARKSSTTRGLWQNCPASETPNLMFVLATPKEVGLSSQESTFSIKTVFDHDACESQHGQVRARTVRPRCAATLFKPVNDAEDSNDNQDVPVLSTFQLRPKFSPVHDLLPEDLSD